MKKTIVSVLITAILFGFISTLNAKKVEAHYGGYTTTYYSPYLNMSTTYDSDGGYATTYYSPYLNSASTYFSDGGYANTYYSPYLNTATTYYSFDY